MTKRVAIVEDDESMRGSIANLLSSVGIATATFESAEVLLAARDVATVECFIVDLRLPGMNGLDLITHLSAGASTIVITAHGDRDTQQRAIDAGVRAYLSKPFRPDELIAHVRAVLAQPRS